MVCLEIATHLVTSQEQCNREPLMKLKTREDNLQSDVNKIRMKNVSENLGGKRRLSSSNGEHRRLA